MPRMWVGCHSLEEIPGKEGRATREHRHLSINYRIMRRAQPKLATEDQPLSFVPPGHSLLASWAKLSTKNDIRNNHAYHVPGSDHADQACAHQHKGSHGQSRRRPRNWARPFCFCFAGHPARAWVSRPDALDHGCTDILSAMRAPTLANTNLEPICMLEGTRPAGPN